VQPGENDANPDVARPPATGNKRKPTLAELGEELQRNILAPLHRVKKSPARSLPAESATSAPSAMSEQPKIKINPVSSEPPKPSEAVVSHEEQLAFARQFWDQSVDEWPTPAHQAALQSTPLRKHFFTATQIDQLKLHSAVCLEKPPYTPERVAEIEMWQKALERWFLDPSSIWALHHECLTAAAREQGPEPMHLDTSATPH
jgi:hypothetical protein